MKLIFSLLLTFNCFLFTVLAQTPASFSYQGVLRDNSGNIISNQTAGFRFSLRSFSPLGLIEYRETHSLTTNTFGLFSTAIGTGTVVAGDINTIDWTAGSMFLQIEVDPANGTNYTDIGTSQLLSVPYAMHSKTSEKIELPFHDTIFDVQDAFYVYNDGDGGGLVGVVGTGGQMGNYVTAVKGIALPSFSNSAGIGVSGQINSWNGIGVKGYNQSGWGIWGETNYGTAIRAEANSGKGIWAESTDGDAAYFYSQNGYALTTEGGWTGIGTTQPVAPLHLFSSGNYWNVNSTYGDLFIGSQTGTGLKIGVTTGGDEAGDVRIRAVGPSYTGRLILGTTVSDILTINYLPTNDAVYINTNNNIVNTTVALHAQHTGVLGGIAIKGTSTVNGASYGVGGYFEGNSTGVYGEGMQPYSKGVFGWSNQSNGAALYGSTSGNGAAALELNNGPMKVSGTNPTAFTVGVGGNTDYARINYPISGDQYVFLINHPLCNSDPSAMLFITTARHLTSPYDHVYGIAYSNYYQQWYIFDTEDGEDITEDLLFNVLVIKR